MKNSLELALSELRPAVFLDRDGTIIQDVGVLKDPGMLKIYPGAIESLLELQKHFLLFVVTNQPGVSQGLVKRGDVDRIHASLDTKLSRYGVRIIEYYACPHAPEDNCQCRKPRPWFLLQAANQFRIDLEKSYVIGDHYSDVLTGRDLGVKGLYVLTGHGEKHLSTLPDGEKVFANLEEASQWILHSDAGLSSPQES